MNKLPENNTEQVTSKLLINPQLNLRFYCFGRNYDGTESVNEVLDLFIKDTQEALDGLPDCVDISITACPILANNDSMAIATNQLYEAMDLLEAKLLVVANVPKNVFNIIKTNIDIMTKIYSDNSYPVSDDLVKVIGIEFETLESDSDDIVTFNATVFIENESLDGETNVNEYRFANFQQVFEITKNL